MTAEKRLTKRYEQVRRRRRRRDGNHDIVQFADASLWMLTKKRFEQAEINEDN
jgi:hypothetical protein